MTQNRKDEHVALAKQFYPSTSNHEFDKISFVHHSLPEMNLDEVDLSTSIAGFRLEKPFYINGMTGGSQKTTQINHDLALVAKETGLPMASGSVSAALKDPSVENSFKVIRKVNPEGLVFANLGAEHSLEHAKKAVDLLQADALQIHINVTQELTMPEGGRHFKGWLLTIEKIVKELGIPVIVKEVGFGMSQETIQQLQNIGVKTIDISGRGGTNFAAIENARRKSHDYTSLLNWGQTTPVSLLEATAYQSQVEIVASGGIQAPMDMIKAFALGAKACGVSGQFLHLVVEEGPEKTIEEVNKWSGQLATFMTLLGKKRIVDLLTTDILLDPSLIAWCEARNIEWRSFATRHKNKNLES